jgi:N-acetylmuramoyl-L-alanine amidase
MIRRNLKRRQLAIILAALCAAVFIFGTRLRASAEDLPIYFADSKLVVESETVNGTLYIPIVQIIQHIGLPYTDALALETLTIRSGTSRLVATRNSALISINDRIVLLRSPILRENGRWLVPVEFLNQGLTRIAGIEFRHRTGTQRIFAGEVQAPEIVMNAQDLGPITRLTIRAGSPMNLNVQHDDPNNRAVVRIDKVPVDPLRERIDQKDRLVNSIAFNDSDGEPKIVLETTEAAGEIRITSADGNRVFFVDVSRRAEGTIEAAPPPVVPAPRVDGSAGERGVRVIVIDPGHGGIDSGANNPSGTEKDLTLALARRLRAALQSQLGATVLLTRDSDIALDNEARSAVANNNQANLFISLHAGYSSNQANSGSSIFVMSQDFGGVSNVRDSRNTLFLPWFLGYRTHRQASGQIAKLLQEELTGAVPGWKFPLRTAPLGVLASATMPAVVVEMGNFNNATNTQTMMDNPFQSRVVAAIVNAVQRFAAVQGPAAD